MKALAVVVAALALTQLAAGQTQPYTSTLFQTYNATSAQTGYLQCNDTDVIASVSPGPGNTAPNGEPLTPLSAAQAGQITVDAVWFGGGVGPASNFQVVGNCSALQLTSNGGHGTTVYTGPVPLAPNGCSVSWFQQTNYLTVYVSITNTGFAWSVSLPTVTSVRAQSSCNGGYQYCTLATGVACSELLNLPTTLLPDGSFPTPAAAPEEEAKAVEAPQEEKPQATLG